MAEPDNPRNQMITVASSLQADVLQRRMAFDPSKTTWLENPGKDKTREQEGKKEVTEKSEK